MKRRITLYIAGQPCDLQDDALVLLNVQREDLYNPAIVLNSYSQAVTLPGTPNNDRIFGHYFRADHAVRGTGFNPLVRVPFSIFADTGEVIVSGYCKLLTAKMDGGVHTYEVQLYGSLGEFIYGLAYDADGNKKTLASLDYLGGGDTELDFVIDKSAVADAWARLGGDTSKPAMWDVVNFAPAYNGIPDGDFDAGKALAKPGDVGLTIPAGQQASAGGYTLLELAANLDEWEARDLRSYLQRPVLSVKALLEAIAKPENNGGWTLDLSDIDTTTEWPYLRTWLTRPLLPSLGTFKQATGALSVTFDNTAVGQRVARFYVTGNRPGEKVFVQMQFKPVLDFTGLTAPHIYMHAASAEPNYTFGVATFIQPVAYDSANNVVAYGNALTLCPNPNIAADTLASYVGYTPQGGTALVATQEDGDYDNVAAGIYWGDKPVTLEVEGKDIASVRIFQTAYTIGWHNATNVLTFRSGDGTSAWAGGFTDPSTSTSWEDADGAASADGSGTATSTPHDSIRSGARVTKRMLLSTEGTPADYLLAICKSFGLYILADGATKTARIVRRSTLYQNETVDLTERVDTSKPWELEPLAIESKFYDWKHADIGAAFGKEYKENTGRDYGAQRVNTGYDFDAKARDVLDGVVLKGTAAVVKSGRFMIQAPKASTLTTLNNTNFSVTGYIRWTDGVVMSSGYHSTPLIPVSEGDIITYTTFGGSASVAVIAAYDAYNAYQQGKSLRGGITPPATYVVPAGVANIRLCTNDVNLASVSATIEQNIAVTPPVFILPGSKYTLWNGDGDSVENDVPQYVGAVTPLRTFGPYDFYDKAQFHAADGKPLDGADVLLLYNGTGDALRSYPLEITDDVADMDTLNGKPCWLFTNNTTPLQLPYFSRYDINIAGWVTLSLDFGVPSEVDIPNLDYFEASTIYAQAWKRYVADRLSVDTKILRCRVRLDGLQVGQGLLRKFYWYRGALWTLNKIENYSLTTFDLAECEFVQVQDIDAYLNG